MSEDYSGFSRRSFLSHSALFGGGLLLGSGLLTGCGAESSSGTGTVAADSIPPRYGGHLRLGILDGNQSGNLDAHKPIGSGIVRGFALYSKLWEWDEQMQPRLALAEFAEPNADANSAGGLPPRAQPRGRRPLQAEKLHPGPTTCMPPPTRPSTTAWARGSTTRNAPRNCSRKPAMNGWNWSW